MMRSSSSVSEQHTPLSFAVLREFFHLPLAHVAKRLGRCTTLLKKQCRSHGVDRWPYRQVKSVLRQLATLELTERHHQLNDEMLALMRSQTAELHRQLEALYNNPNDNPVARSRRDMEKQRLRKGIKDRTPRAGDTIHLDVDAIAHLAGIQPASAEEAIRTAVNSAAGSSGNTAGRRSRTSSAASAEDAGARDGDVATNASHSDVTGEYPRNAFPDGVHAQPLPQAYWPQPATYQPTMGSMPMSMPMMYMAASMSAVPYYMGWPTQQTPVNVFSPVSASGYALPSPVAPVSASPSRLPSVEELPAKRKKRMKKTKPVMADATGDAFYPVHHSPSLYSGETPKRDRTWQPVTEPVQRRSRMVAASAPARPHSRHSRQLVQPTDDLAPIALPAVLE